MSITEQCEHISDPYLIAQYFRLDPLTGSTAASTHNDTSSRIERAKDGRSTLINRHPRAACRDGERVPEADSMRHTNIGGFGVCACIVGDDRCHLSAKVPSADDSC